jgi:hypothetical protein
MASGIGWHAGREERSVEVFLVGRRWWNWPSSPGLDGGLGSVSHGGGETMVDDGKKRDSDASLPGARNVGFRAPQNPSKFEL